MQFTNLVSCQEFFNLNIGIRAAAVADKQLNLQIFPISCVIEATVTNEKYKITNTTRTKYFQPVCSNYPPHLKTTHFPKLFPSILTNHELANLENICLRST